MLGLYEWLHEEIERSLPDLRTPLILSCFECRDLPLKCCRECAHLVTPGGMGGAPTPKTSRTLRDGDRGDCAFDFRSIVKPCFPSHNGISLTRSAR